LEVHSEIDRMHYEAGEKVTNEHSFRTKFPPIFQS